MKSNWDTLKERTSYHFDPFKNDPAYDTMKYVGRFEGNWTSEMQQTIASSQEVTWRTRNPVDGVSKDIDAEEYDLIRAGVDADLALTNLEYELKPVFQKMVDALKLEGKQQSRVHVQMPGHVWNMHIDKLEKFNLEDPSRVFRFMIMLEDWKPGHFIQYGNFVHTQYKAGEIYSFDWMNVPHCTANAGFDPRCTLLVTGTASTETYKLIAEYDTVIQV